MPNKFDQRKLVDQLIHDKDVELMPYELNDMLEKELSKPADQIDMQFVDELLDLLGAEEPTAAERQACWQSIQKKMPAKKTLSWKSAMRRIAAAAAVLVVLFFASFESAKAFQWTFLLKLLAPVAETFGIYSTSTFGSDDPVNDNTALLNEDTEYEQLTYLSLEEMPSEISGYRIIPGWIPERFAFVQGSVYEDPDMAHCSMLYSYESEYLNITTSIFYNEDAVFGFEYERTLPEPLTEVINGYSVSYYHNNSNEKRLSASWIEETTHYHIDGNVTEKELKQIIYDFTK